jgi:hypothetical protein
VVFAPGGGTLDPPLGICAGEASRATVTRGENKAHSFA